MVRHLSIDIETFSSVDIKKSGLYRYVEAGDFQVMLFAYSCDHGPVELIDLMAGQEIPEEIRQALFDPQCVKQAYNAAFEWYCLCKHFGVKYPNAWLPQWRCTMAWGLYCGYTAGLATTGEVLGLPQDKRKLGTGGSLIRTFCVPCKPSKANGNRTRTMPWHEPDRWELFKEYCRQDVTTEMEIALRLAPFPMPAEEQRLWELDQVINARGVQVDSRLIESAIQMGQETAARLKEEALQISGINPKSTKQLTKWLEDEGEEVENLQKESVAALIAGTDNATVQRMLEIRQGLSKTSIKKFDAMKLSLCGDGRIRGLLQYYGGNRTGRWAGRIVQVHNLKKNDIHSLDLARRYAKEGTEAALQVLYGDLPDTLSQLVRTAFVPKEGHVLMVADFSAIEARVIAWLAGESWRQEVFATHGKIYEASAAAMFGVPIETITRGGENYHLRQRGKVAELALGYQGNKGALINMGALKMGLTEEELPDIVRRWRESNKRIVGLWYAFENAAMECMHTCRQTGAHGILFAREGHYSTNQDFLTVQLPSGRKLYYARPFLAPNQWDNESIHYYGVHQEKKKWGEQETYGGKLAENITQAIARDCLAVALQRLEANGYRVVMHVHDEAVIELPLERTDPWVELEFACRLMGESIPWAQDLLLRADGFLAEYYRKE